MIAKIHLAGDRKILALCDNNLVGKKFADGDFSLDLTALFYQGEPLEKDEIKELISQANTINAVGSESVGLLEEYGVIKDENIKFIDGIPYVIVAFV